MVKGEKKWERRREKMNFGKRFGFFFLNCLINVPFLFVQDLHFKGTLRVLLVILHDFPELLCEYHIVICDTIPPNCVQLRNLVLSAYPKNMRLPDPFGSNLKVTYCFFVKPFCTLRGAD